jgi:hypothetical protein
LVFRKVVGDVLFSEKDLANQTTVGDLVGRPKIDLFPKNGSRQFVFSGLSAEGVQIWGVIALRADAGTSLAVPLPLRGNLERVTINDEETMKAEWLLLS